MYFATAGQQATQPPPPGARVPSAMSQQGLGQSGFPSIGGGMGRSGPPGFAGRSTGWFASLPLSLTYALSDHHFMSQREHVIVQIPLE